MVLVTITTREPTQCGNFYKTGLLARNSVEEEPRLVNCKSINLGFASKALAVTLVSEIRFKLNPAISSLVSLPIQRIKKLRSCLWWSKISRWVNDPGDTNLAWSKRQTCNWLEMTYRALFNLPKWMSEWSWTTQLFRLSCLIILVTLFFQSISNNLRWSEVKCLFSR